MVGKQDIEGKLTQLTKILPISTVAFDIFNMTSAETYENAKIAAAAGRDATLGVDILRLANSSYYNYSSKKIVNLSEAISHIGQKRVGELALATNMMVALTPRVLPWMDIELTWHRSMTASVATDYLAEKMGIPQKENRLFLSSISYPLGRIALCMLYPEIYQKMIRLCQANQGSLKDEERQFFSLPPEEVMGFLLKAWNIPSLVFEPLVYSSRAYNTIASLGEPLSTRVELLENRHFGRRNRRWKMGIVGPDRTSPGIAAETLGHRLLRGDHRKDETGFPRPHQLPRRQMRTAARTNGFREAENFAPRRLLQPGPRFLRFLRRNHLAERPGIKGLRTKFAAAQHGGDRELHRRPRPPVGSRAEQAPGQSPNADLDRRLANRKLQPLRPSAPPPRKLRSLAIGLPRHFEVICQRCN